MIDNKQLNGDFDAALQLRSPPNRPISSTTNRSLEVPNMLWTLFVIMLVLWLLGMVTSYTLGGFIHILLVLAVIALVFQLITGRRAV